MPATINSKRVGIYARVSTKEQNTENQLLDLRRYCEARGWEIVAECVDKGISGAKDDRPQLKKVMELARKRQIDVLLVWRFDRFSRSLRHLVSTLEELKSLGVDFVSYSENLDSTSHTGTLLFGIVGAIAQFERAIITERVHAGLRRARSQGKRLGRPNAEFNLDEARRLLKAGNTMTAVGTKLGVSRMTIGRKLGLTVQNPLQKRGVGTVGADIRK